MNTSLLTIQNRCWKYATIGFEVLFMDYEYVKKNGIYFPNTQKFIRVGLRYSEQVKNIVLNIINKENFIS
jgi:hypothetical protein